MGIKMNFKEIGKQFEKWRKKFLKKRNKKYNINDKRDRNFTGKEKPPNVYKKPYQDIYTQGTVGSFFEDFFGFKKPYHDAFETEEHLRTIGHNQDSRGYVNHAITKHDIYDIRVALEMANDVNDFIKQI